MQYRESKEFNLRLHNSKLLISINILILCHLSHRIRSTVFFYFMLVLMHYFRVDAVYGDTLKIASGLGQSTKQDNEKEGDGDHSQDDQVPTNEWRKLSDQYA